MLDSLETPDLHSSTEAYAQRFAGSVGQYFLQVQLHYVLQCLPAPEGCRILDIGGGHAQLAKPLIQRGYDVTIFGSDDSCGQRLDQILGPHNYHLRSGDLLNLPLESNSYDVVLAFRLLPHLNNWRRFLSEVCRVARRAVILDYPDVRSVNWFSDKLFAIKDRIEKNTRTYRCFRRQEITGHLLQCGFRRSEVHCQFFFPMALHRLVKSSRLSKLTEGAARGCGLTHWLGSPVILHATP